jgi:hypothetical protein
MAKKTHPPVSSVQQSLFELAVESNTTPTIQEKKLDTYVFDLLDTLQSPILTFSQSWADTLPVRLLNNVTIARIIALKREEELATFLECSIYIYTRTLEGPMDTDWTDIYTHVTCKTLQDWFGEDHWEAVRAPRELNEWLLKKLDGLRKHIYQKRRASLKDRLRAQPHIDRTEVKKTLSKKSTSLNDPTQQGSIF